MASDLKVHSFDEVAKHNNKDDCWLIISGKVYDVTPFLDDHPGGDEVLVTATAKDATDEFEDVGHSDSAREMLDKYYVGELDSSSVPVKTKYTPLTQVTPPASSANSPGFGIKVLQFLVPLLILAIAFGLRYYAKKE